ncbi:MAG: hypothetical protein KY462_10125 [Actinobacteria bacterium]|nr:hypothetical protein [Actinomycetota bacterium]
MGDRGRLSDRNAPSDTANQLRERPLATFPFDDHGALVVVVHEDDRDRITAVSGDDRLVVTAEFADRCGYGWVREGVHIHPNLL